MSIHSRRTIRAASMLCFLMLAFALMAFNTPPALASGCRFVAHKGNVGNPKVIENTLEAFRYAAKVPGIWGIETDIWRTADGRYVCVHCKNPTMASWCGLNVSKCTLEKLQGRVKRGTGHLSTLEQYLKACRKGGKWAFIQIQDEQMNSNDDWAREVVGVVKDSHMLKRCVFTGSCNLSRGIDKIKDAARTEHGVEVIGAIGSGSSKSKKSVNIAIHQAKIRDIDSIGVYAKHTKKAAYARDKLKKAKSSTGASIKLRLNGEGVKSEKQARKLLNKYDAWCIYTTGFKPKTYTVRFVDQLTGKTFAKQRVGYKWDATMAKDKLPAHKGYAFKKWSTNGKRITKNTTITAIYRKTG